MADADEVEKMRERIRFELAAKRITDDPRNLNQFDNGVAKALLRLARDAELESRIAVTRAYAHLYWPENAPASSHLRHLQLAFADPGKMPKGPHTPVIVDALRSHGKITDSEPPTDLLAHAGGFGKVRKEISTAELTSLPWRDHRQKIVLTASLLTKTISAGIANGTWVYYDPQADRAWGKEDPPPAVRSAPDTMLYTPARATELNLLRKRVDWSAISTVLTASGGPFDGASLRRELTAALAGEPPKAEVLGALASAVRADCQVAVSLSSPPPAEPLELVPNLRLGRCQQTRSRRPNSMRCSSSFPHNPPVRPNRCRCAVLVSRARRPGSLSEISGMPSPTVVSTQ